jgi:hypothetical protein
LLREFNFAVVTPVDKYFAIRYEVRSEITELRYCIIAAS